MALGLVTGIIGTVVNTIGSMGGKGIAGTILLSLSLFSDTPSISV